jgi:hypothetical protein
MENHAAGHDPHPIFHRRNNTLWVLRIALNDSSHPSAASLDRNMPFVFGKAFSYNPATGELRLGKFPLSALASKDPHRIVRKNRRDF